MNDQHPDVARVAARDPAAIRDTYQTYGRLVYAVAYRVLGNVALAEDAVEQAFVHAFREAESDGSSGPPGLRMATIAHRVAIDVDHRERHRRTAEAPGVPDPAPGRSLPSREQTYAVWEVRRALQDLPVEDRELIRLQQRSELTPAEIAGQLALPLDAVKSRSVRAHRRLAILLGHVRTAT
ncbi:MAG: sigma-70 family RNA polymerase sigma factor [Pseudonocardiales bacterium]